MAAIPSLTYGVELEVITPMSRREVAALITAAGVECYDATYGHTVRSYWKVVSDASVSGGCEIVSPILQGKSGLAELAKVCNALSTAGVKVNKSCGFHVHVGARELSSTTMGYQNLAKQWLKWEEHLDRIVSPSRRRSENRFCVSNLSRVRQQMSRLSATLPDMFKAVNKCRTVAEVVRLLNGTDDYMQRYHKLNLVALYRHGTVEIRMHQGTVDATKACEWVRVCLDIVWAAQEYTMRQMKIGGTQHATWERFIAGLSNASTRNWVKDRADFFRTAPAAREATLGVA